jgi:hypothetical protein
LLLLLLLLLLCLCFCATLQRKPGTAGGGFVPGLYHAEQQQPNTTNTALLAPNQPHTSTQLTAAAAVAAFVT